MIQTNDLNYGYTTYQPVLKKISLQLPEGHIYGLLGKNGVGKSTLLKILTGALLGEGEYKVGGYDPRERKAEMQQQIRLVPGNEVLFDVTIKQLADVTAPLYPTFDYDLLENALKEFEVPTDKKITLMSLGQQKKALISLSLACNTPYLFMDEPTNGMDIPSKSSFRRIVASSISDNSTVLISTHQVDDLEGLIDYVVILENDGVLLSASLQEIGQKLCFGVAEEGDEVLYSEQNLRGAWSVMVNKTGEEMPVDIKLLFSAVVKRPEVFKKIFG